MSLERSGVPARTSIVATEVPTDVFLSYNVAAVKLPITNLNLASAIRLYQCFGLTKLVLMSVVITTKPQPYYYDITSIKLAQTFGRRHENSETK